MRGSTAASDYSHPDCHRRGASPAARVQPTVVAGFEKLAHPRGAHLHDGLESLEILYIDDGSHIAHDIRVDVVRIPVVGSHLAVVERRIKSFYYPPRRDPMARPPRRTARRGGKAEGAEKRPCLRAIRRFPRDVQTAASRAISGFSSERKDFPGKPFHRQEVEDPISSFTCAGA